MVCLIYCVPGRKGEVVGWVNKQYTYCRRMSLAQNWRRRGMFDEVAFIFPNAPMIPITVVCLLRILTSAWYQWLNNDKNFGMTMPGWYDLAKLGRDVRSIPTPLSIHTYLTPALARLRRNDSPPRRAWYPPFAGILRDPYQRAG